MTDEWSYGVPVNTDTTNFEWSYGTPYIITELGGTVYTIDITIDAVSSITDDVSVTYKFNILVDAVTTTAYTVSQTYKFDTRIDAITTVQPSLNLAFAINTLINAVSEVIDNLSVIIVHQIATNIDATTTIGTLQQSLSRFNLGSFNLLGFGAQPEIYSLDLSVLRDFEILIDALTTVEDYLIINPAYMDMEINSITDTSNLINVLYSLFSRADGVSDVSVSVSGGGQCSVVIDTISGTTFTIHIHKGYPLRVSLTSVRRPGGLSVTKRNDGLSVSRRDVNLDVDR